MGHVDSGKSTFVGVLNTNELDNGNGSARISAAKHPHEINSGKTSDISLRHFIVKEKNRAITMIDLCGHEKYFKTILKLLSTFLRFFYDHLTTFS